MTSNTVTFLPHWVFGLRALLSRFFARHYNDQVDAMESYLGKATSLTELEHRQRNWDRTHASSMWTRSH